MARALDLDELVEHWTLLDDERELIAGKRGPTRLGFAMLGETRHEQPADPGDRPAPTMSAANGTGRRRRFVDMTVHDEVMTEGDRMQKWLAAIAGGALVTGLGVFLAAQGLDKADKWASVFGLFVALAGLVLAVVGAIGARRQAGGQSVTDSTIGGGVAQIRKVGGSVRLGPDTAPATRPSPHAASPAPVPPSTPADGTSDGQSVGRSWTAGPVRQVDDVGGDAELDR